MINNNRYIHLLDSVEKLIYTIVNKYSVKGFSDDDLFQECQTRLWEIRSDYDPLRGEFTTFVYNVLPNYIKSIARKESSEIRSNHIKIDGNNDVTLKNTTNYDITRHVERTKYSPKELDVLLSLHSIGSRDEYKQVLDGLLRNETFATIGKRLGVSRQRTHQIWVNLLNEVKGEVVL